MAVTSQGITRMTSACQSVVTARPRNECPASYCLDTTGQIAVALQIFSFHFRHSSYSYVPSHLMSREAILAVFGGCDIGNHRVTWGARPWISAGRHPIAQFGSLSVYGLAHEASSPILQHLWPLY